MRSYNKALSFSAGVVLLCAGITFFKEKDILNAKIIDKNIAKVNDSLYAYRYETSNFEYRYFLNSLRTTNTTLYELYYPDTLAWRGQSTYCDPLVEYYHLHPGFDNYPTVGVSYDGAIAYCKWLTDLYNKDPKREFKKVQFNLPSTSEWEMAARGGRAEAIYPWGNYYLRDKSGAFLANFKRIDETSVVKGADGKPVLSNQLPDVSAGLNDRAFYTAEVRSFYPNSIGLFNMSGNVAEMTIEKGNSKGGSFNSYGGEIRIASSKHYDDPSADLGFRVFMRVIEK